jgi:hypothetical protein
MRGGKLEIPTSAMIILKTCTFIVCYPLLVRCYSHPYLASGGWNFWVYKEADFVSDYSGIELDLKSSQGG